MNRQSVVVAPYGDYNYIDGSERELFKEIVKIIYKNLINKVNK